MRKYSNSTWENERTSRRRRRIGIVRAVILLVHENGDVRLVEEHNLGVKVGQEAAPTTTAIAPTAPTFVQHVHEDVTIEVVLIPKLTTSRFVDINATLPRVKVTLF